uniref:TIR domain-containing protein n=1 Tax=Leptobrachium leishanense TaxID=445787 RepID=A0A8C5M1V6_9ANUR
MFVMETLITLSGLLAVCSFLGDSNIRTFPCDIIENEAVTVFDCNARRLKQVPQPIKYSANFTELLLSNNLINTIHGESFNNWHNLTTINLNTNHYSKIKTDNPDICKRGLEIKEDTFTDLTRLEELFIDHNYLCRIPSGIPTSLRILSLKENNIFSVTNQSFLGLSSLEKLYLSKNCYYGNNCNTLLEIQDGAFSRLRKLRILSLNANNLTNVPPMLPSSLEELYLSNNKIQIIGREDFINLVNLKVLHLSGNCPRCYNAEYPCEPCADQSSIKIDENAFWNLRNLNVLNLASTSLKSIPSKWFKNTTFLKVLHLQKNFLVNEIKTADFLLNLPLLEVLDLSFNFELNLYLKSINISYAFSNLTSLKQLHIQGYVFNRISSSSLDPLTKLNNLNLINFGVNFLKQVDFTVFQRFPNLKEIYLNENKISPLTEHVDQSKGFDASPADGTGTFSNFDPLSLNPGGALKYMPEGKSQCISSGKAMDLSKNNIFFIDKEQFRSFGDITCLNLSANGIGQDLRGTEFTYLKKLIYLDLSYNKIDFASYNAFQEIPTLEILDLSFNKHYFMVEYVTHDLDFIENLNNLKVLNLSFNEISTLTDSNIKSNSLQELRFAGNRLDVLWKEGDKRYVNIFRDFFKLSVLDISHNRLRMISKEVIRSLPRKLTELHLNNNNLMFFAWENLLHFKNLTLLNLCSNRITKIASNLVSYTHSLRTLKLCHNMIAHLPSEFLSQAENLTHLDLNYNYIRNINSSIFLSGNKSFLSVLMLTRNPFDCTCDIADFIKWINTNNVIIPRLATDVRCATPNNKKGNGIIYFDVQACSLDSTSMLLFFSTFILIVILSALPIITHLFYWDLWFVYQMFMARFKRNHTITSVQLYDAYITYDTTDEAVSDWVFNELCHHLEHNRKRDAHLCVEERDWEPGKAIIDNIIQSIDGSKKTLFVLTKKYVKNGKFKIAFYLALQKLMDENLDVIIIVLLQPVLQNSQYLRFRKKICKSSILEWPKNPHAEDLFWQRLRNVLLTDNSSRYNQFYIDTIKT